MHAFAQALDHFFGPLAHVSSMLAAQFSRLACGVPPLGAFGLAAAVVVSIMFAAMCALWAVSERLRSIRHRERLMATLQRLQSGIHFRDSLLASFPEALVVLRCTPSEALSFSDGRKLLQHCLAGPDATRLAAAIDRLMTGAERFRTRARTMAIRDIRIRGQLVGDRAVLFLQALDRERVETGTATADAPAAAPAISEQSVEIGDCIVPRGNGLNGDSATDSRMHSDGVLTIGADGRVKQYNKAFARQWSLSDEILQRAPQLHDVVLACRKSKGPDAIWDVVTAALCSAEPELHGCWGALRRGDGQAVSLSLSRLADGATSVRFTECLGGYLSRSMRQEAFAT